jgi:hypothetical protein
MNFSLNANSVEAVSDKVSVILEAKLKPYLFSYPEFAFQVSSTREEGVGVRSPLEDGTDKLNN